MKTFMFIYRGPAEMPEMSPEEMQADMDAWIGWIEGAIEAGWMTDGGEALMPDNAAVVRDGMSTDGPMVESKELVGGYSLIVAKDLEAAKAYASDCPGVLSGGSLEIREVMPIPG